MRTATALPCAAAGPRARAAPRAGALGAALQPVWAGVRRGHPVRGRAPVHRRIPPAVRARGGPAHGPRARLLRVVLRVGARRRCRGGARRVRRGGRARGRRAMRGRGRGGRRRRRGREQGARGRRAAAPAPAGALRHHAGGWLAPGLLLRAPHRRRRPRGRRARRSHRRRRPRMRGRQRTTVPGSRGASWQPRCRARRGAPGQRLRGRLRAHARV